MKVKRLKFFLRFILVVIIILLVSALITTGCFHQAGEITRDGGRINKTEMDREDTKKMDIGKISIDMSKPVVLKWYVPNEFVSQTDGQRVMEHVHEYLKPKMNTKIDLQILSWSDYAAKINVAFASNEQFDLVWNGSWVNFYLMASKLAYVDIKDMLSQYAPELYESISPFIWDAVTIKNKIFCVPNMQPFASIQGLFIRNDILDKMGYDKSKIKTIDDVDAFYNQVLRADPALIPNWSNNDFAVDLLFNLVPWFGIGDKYSPGVAVYDEENKVKVINQFKTPELMKMLSIVHKWVNEGKMNREYILNQTEPVRKKYAWRNVSFFYAGSPAQMQNTFLAQNPETFAWDKKNGVTYSFLPLEGCKKYITTSQITATLTCVSATSKNPERAVVFLNLLNTDPTLYNMMVHGIESVHFEKAGANKLRYPENFDLNKKTYEQANWEIGNTYLDYFYTHSPDQYIELYKTWDNDAIVEPIAGFNFDPESVKNELANCSAVVTEMKVALFAGIEAPEKLLPRFLEKMKAAGSEKIIDEKQRQLDEWLTSKQ